MNRDTQNTVRDKKKKHTHNETA